MASHADWNRDKMRAVAGYLAPAEPTDSTLSDAARAGVPRPSAVARLRQQQRRRFWYLAAMVTVLDAAIIGPLFGRGSLLLLDFGDYPPGRHPPLTLSAFGFPPGITSRAPVDATVHWVFQNLPWPVLHLVPFAAVAPIACVGFARLFPERRLAVGAAALLFTVNPFVYERMASGQVYVVMGYALLPVLLALIVRPLDSLIATAALGGLLLALDIALSVHYLFVAGLLLVIVVSAHAVFRRTTVVRAGASIAACAAVLNLYWLVPAVRAIRTMPSHVTSQDLSAFQTLADRTWGLAVNVAGMYGFWRSGPPLVKSHISGWPFLLLAILLVIGFGLYEMRVREQSPGPALAWTCVALVIVGGLLAMGEQGPTGGLYTWLFGHIPGFKVMREAGKFSALVALGYATCFGAGADAVVRPLTRHLSRVLCVCCLAAVPLLYGYTELWGFDGYARPTSYPASWAAAARSMSQAATALALPWRAYLRVPWAGGQVIANPLPSYFARPVISADDLEAGSIETETSNPRSLFLQFCLSEGGRITEFGRLLAPLGIRYVLLAKVPGVRSFGWLERQHDLKRVFDSRAITVYKNEEAVAQAYEPSRHLVVRDWGAVVALAQRVPLVDYLIQVRHAHPGPLYAPANIASEPSSAPLLIRTAGGSPVSQPLDLPGATQTVVLTDPAYPGWRLPGFRTASQFGVTVAFTGHADAPGHVRLVAGYGPWRLVEACDLAGAFILAADVTLLSIFLVRRRSRAA